MSRSSTLKLDTYTAQAACAAARTSYREYLCVREMLAGERKWGAQVRLLIELHKRGHVDINDLVAP